MADSTPASERTVVIEGVGLIGGSIAASLRRLSPGPRILGIGRDLARLEMAAEVGLLDGFGRDAADLSLDEPVVAVSCLPVAFIVQSVVRLSGTLPAGSVVTDAGSVKQRICEGVEGKLNSAVPFVPAHPIAGREQSGFEAALPDLFDGSLCILTATDLSDSAAVDRVERFWMSLGCRVVRTTPAEHDRVLAIVSHLPHVAAAALAGIAEPSETKLSGTGFRDTTRIAAGSPELWRQILLNNQHQVAAAIDHLIRQLSAYRNAIVSGDDDHLLRLLREAASARALLEDPVPEHG